MGRMIEQILDLTRSRLAGSPTVTPAEMDSCVPIIVHSSATNQAPVGLTDVLRKPVKLERLLAVVGEHCAQASDG